MTTQSPARRIPQAPMGAKPSNSQKLIYVSDKLGLSGLKGMQGSTVNIVDTVALNTNTDRQILNFFSQTQGKSRNFSNFQTGQLQAGEAMVIEEVAFILLLATTADLTDNANAILDAVPLSQASSNALPNAKGIIAGSLMNIIIANQTVVKDYNGFEMIPSFNPKATGLVALDSSDSDIRTVGPDKINLEAPPVLPPNQGIKITLEISPTGTVPSYTFIMCVAGRFGSIFASKTTL